MPQLGHAMCFSWRCVRECSNTLFRSRPVKVQSIKEMTIEMCTTTMKVLYFGQPPEMRTPLPTS